MVHAKTEPNMATFYSEVSKFLAAKRATVVVASLVLLSACSQASSPSSTATSSASSPSPVAADPSPESAEPSPSASPSATETKELTPEEQEQKELLLKAQAELREALALLSGGFVPDWTGVTDDLPQADRPAIQKALDAMDNPDAEPGALAALTPPQQDMLFEVLVIDKNGNFEAGGVVPYTGFISMEDMRTMGHDSCEYFDQGVPLVEFVEDLFWDYVATVPNADELTQDDADLIQTDEGLAVRFGILSYCSAEHSENLSKQLESH